MLKREWGAESNERQPRLFIPSKAATLVPEFVGKICIMGKTVALEPEFAVKDLPLGRTYDIYINRLYFNSCPDYCRTENE